MSNLSNQPFGSTRAQKLHQVYKSAGNWMFLIAICTTFNIISLLLGGNYYLLLSSIAPFIIVLFGMIFCGVVPAELTEEFAGLQIFDPPVLVFFILIAFAVIGFYLLSAIFSKKDKVGWLIFALVFFSIDSVITLLYYGLTIDVILDLLFHIIVVVSLARGVSAYYKFKKLPPEEQLTEKVETAELTPNENLTDSPILRPADFSVKSRILLEETFQNHKIIYRRVKRVNELIIDGNVYAEYQAFIEFNHGLFASVDGHNFIAGMQQ